MHVSVATVLLLKPRNRAVVVTYGTVTMFVATILGMAVPTPLAQKSPAVVVTYGTVTMFALTILGMSAPVPPSQEGHAIVATFGTVMMIAMRLHVELLHLSPASVATFGTERTCVLTAKI